VEGKAVRIRTGAFLQSGVGMEHSERDYCLAEGFAHDDGLEVHADVLFAAAMLHDMAAFAPYD